MSRVAIATRLGLREQLRRPLIPVLVIGLPFFFITRAIASTEAIPRAVDLPGGDLVLTTMREIHGADMAAITVAFLGGVLGVFVMRRASLDADRRLVIAGFRPWQVLAPRLMVLGAGILLAVGASLAVTAINFEPMAWMGFAGGTLAAAVIYGLLGTLAGLVMGPLGATYLILFTAMLDLGIAQNPMFGTGSPPAWSAALPGYGPGRIIIEASFSQTFDGWAALGAAITWIVALAGAVVAAGGRRLAPRV